MEGFEGDVMGVEKKSMREVKKDEIDSVKKIMKDEKVNINVEEKVKEVEECIEWYGKRKVEWIMDNKDVKERWCIIKEKNMREEEKKNMEKDGEIEGIWKVKEENIGDGNLNEKEFDEDGGKLGIG